MSSHLTPPRRRGFEILDDLAVEDCVRKRSLDDVARSNTIFGGARAVLVELAKVLGDGGTRTLTLLDVGTGIGDIPARAKAEASERGITISTFGIDISPTLLYAARTSGCTPVCADALALPVATKSVDVAICSQLLHHFETRDTIAVLRELDRVARRRVIVSDLRRSWIAAAGIWMASFPLRFHPVSRHDGVVSVLRGFTRTELRDLVRAAVGCDPVVREHRGFRTTARWTPRHRTYA
ncbi:MAG TPA: methyltransferase domain-containing protein [Gemmatimonadaceae bacterium]|nr:methyltransferase domain-containing protein [Gemmatimonadaceae bacterium]